MNKEIADRWVAALRSGEYEQGRGQLREGKSFCCLGVLCDIYQKEQGKGHWQDLQENGLYEFADDEIGLDWSEVLPDHVMEWAGMCTTAGTFAMGEEFNTLVELNDDDGSSFPQIADTIEQKWEVL
jgi:hypothetical protein